MSAHNGTGEKTSQARHSCGPARGSATNAFDAFVQEYPRVLDDNADVLLNPLFDTLSHNGVAFNRVYAPFRASFGRKMKCVPIVLDYIATVCTLCV